MPSYSEVPDAVHSARSEIAVDIIQLTDFADLIGRENAENLMPTAFRVRAELSEGVQFGARSLSNEVHALRVAYASVLVETIGTLNHLVTLSDALAGAIRDAAQLYVDVDATSAGGTQRIASALNAAWDTAAQTTTDDERDFQLREDNANARRRVNDVAAKHARLDQEP